MAPTLGRAPAEPDLVPAADLGRRTVPGSVRVPVRVLGPALVRVLGPVLVRAPTMVPVLDLRPAPILLHRPPAIRLSKSGNVNYHAEFGSHQKARRSRCQQTSPRSFDSAQ